MISMSGSWRNLIIVGTVARLLLSNQLSYLHPDEFFQSFQIIYNNNLPWEVLEKSNINRSIFPLLFTHFPMILFGKYYSLTPFQILVLVKFQLTILSWLITDWCLYRLIPIKHERIKATLFTVTSYLTLVHQSHTFSNSTETLVLLPTLYVINDIRSYLEQVNTEKKEKTIPSYSSTKLIVLGFLISFGTFNRITFIAWILFPSFFLLRFFLNYPIRSFIPIISFIISCFLIIYIDTLYYETSPTITIAPLNNLLYNMSTSNLQQHGIHSRITHILINYPQMVGPLIFLIFPFNFSYTKTTTFLSIISGFIILSIFPHQELRFLLPAVPLLSSIINFSNPDSKILSKYSKYALTLWIIYTSIMSIFYGLVHQAGIVPSLIKLNDTILDKYSNFEANVNLIFWRTYPPPTWMIESEKLSHVAYIERIDNLDTITIPKIDQNRIITLKGSPVSTVESAYKQIKKIENNDEVLLIAPIGAMLNIDGNLYEPLWEYSWHLDMDHFEYDLYGIETFTPGIGIYKLLL